VTGVQTCALPISTTRISDVRRVVLTVKDGTVYDPVKLYEAIGVKPGK
jgi:hypothetical protein